MHYASHRTVQRIRLHTWLWSLLRRLVPIGACVITAGCGVSSLDKSGMRRARGADPGDAVALQSIATEGNVVAVLAKHRLVDNAIFVITLIRTGSSYEVALATEGPARNERDGKRRMVSYGGSSGVAITGGATAAQPLELIVSGGCVDGSPYGVAYGVLRDAGGSVTAIAKNKNVRFVKVPVPTRFHAVGSVVYALLMPGKNRIVVRNRRGHILSGEWRSGRPNDNACAHRAA